MVYTVPQFLVVIETANVANSFTNVTTLKLFSGETRDMKMMTEQPMLSIPLKHWVSELLNIKAETGHAS